MFSSGDHKPEREVKAGQDQDLDERKTLQRSLEVSGWRQLVTEAFYGLCPVSTG